MKFKHFTFLLFLVSCSATYAQVFKWQADLAKVNTSGFYKVALTPQIISKTKSADLSDIRIFEKNKEIAYLIRKMPDSMFAVPAPLLSVKEDHANHRTIVDISFKAKYQVDKLVLNLKGFRYYRRSAWLTEINPLIKDKRNRYSDQRLKNLIISSEKLPIIEFPEQDRYEQLFLVIENEDSQPLSVKNVEAYQKNIELITYLEKDKQYVMKTGQLNMPLPRYDLSYFNDSIKNSIPFISTADFKMHDDKQPEKDSTLIKKSWMWMALGLLILFLGYLSYFMVKDMQRKK